MIGLAELKALNARPPVIRDNFNRDSSSVQSAKGFVIHSGIHRSTAFISKTEHANCWFAFQYWREQGQAAVNAFIEVIIDDGELETAEANAFHATRKGWQVDVKRPKQSFAGGCELTARKDSGKLRLSVGAATWRHLHARTGGKP
jgi:hypothetical protein